MRRVVVVGLFAAVLGAVLWLSLFPTGESRLPRRASTPTETSKTSESSETRRVPPSAPTPRSSSRESDTASPSRPSPRADSAAAAAPRRDVGESGAEAGSTSQDELEAAAERVQRETEHRLLETKVASVAVSHGLISAIDLERQVERVVPAGSVPPDELEQAKADARRSILADAAIVEFLTRRKLGDDAPREEVQRYRGLGHTLLSTQDDDYRDRMMEQVAAEAGD